MSFEAFSQYPPVDVDLVDRIVCKLKSQGIFDQFRKDCLADVDTKPAYQNLQQRVNGTVATFLSTQTWQEDLNKTQLRESLRRHVQQGFLEVGVDRIVDQVVNPKVFTVFMPKVEDVVYDCLGIEKPKHTSPSNNSLSGRKITLVDLLPTDLDPVSPESDNLSFGDDEETKDETNNNGSTPKLDISHDSQVSGISDLSSHMGDTYKENQENSVDSNTLKSVGSLQESASELHFENFKNLSEKIKQAEIGQHNSVTSTQPDVLDDFEPMSTMDVDNNITRDNKEEISMEVDSVSNSTFDDKLFNYKIVKEDTCSRTVSEDSLSCSSFSSKLKKEKSKSLLTDICVNSQDKSEISTPCKESSSDKEFKGPIINESVQLKVEEKVLEMKEPIKTEEPKDKKHRDSSSSSKTSKSSSDKYRSSESKHRSSVDKKDDLKQFKEKTSREDKDKVGRDEKDKSGKHKDDRQYSSKDKHRDKDKTHERNREKDSEKRKDKTDSKDIFENEKKEDKEKQIKEKTRHDKDYHKYEKEKDRSEKEKDRSEKEKERNEREKERDRREKDKERQEKEKVDREKDKQEKCKRDKEKVDKEKRDKYESREKDKDRSKDRSRDKEKSKSEKDKKNSKDKDFNNKFIDEKSKDEKRKESKKYDQTPSSSKKDDTSKSDVKDKHKKIEENLKEKEKSEEDRRERKRKIERCNDEIKLKEARRSWDRDNGGANGKSHGSHKPNSNDYKGSTSTSSAKEKKTGESSNQQKTSERSLDPVGEAEEPSDVDKILMKLNSSIEESQNISYNDERSVKKPKIAKNIFEIKKIMQARKNLARQMRQEKKKKEGSHSGMEDDVTDSPSTAQPNPQVKNITIEENKENIKTGQSDKMKNMKICHIKGKFSGFLESDIEKSRSSLDNFRIKFLSYCQSIGMNVATTDSIENIDFTKVCDFNEALVDDNLNNLKPKPVTVARRSYHDDNQVNRVVENIISGKNGCYVLLKDCTQYVKTMKNPTHQDSPMTEGDNTPNKQSPSRQQSIEDSSKDIKLNVSGEQTHSNVKQTSSKAKTNSASAVAKSGLQLQECVVELEPVFNSSQQHEASLKRGSTAHRQAAKQDHQDDSPSSPGLTISVALNPYLNDIERPPSVSLTEAMLDNLMRESTLQVDDEGFEDSDDSDNEYSNQFQDSIKKIEEDQKLFDEKELIEHNTPKESESFHSSEDVEATGKEEGLNGGNWAQKNEVTGSFVSTPGCDIVSIEKGSRPEACEEKTVKRRNQRLSRSASQRYDNNDLYKPRPVLPQNAKRVRAPRSVSSEELPVGGQYDGTPMKKRAR